MAADKDGGVKASRVLVDGVSVGVDNHSLRRQRRLHPGLHVISASRQTIPGHPHVFRHRHCTGTRVARWSTNSVWSYLDTGTDQGTAWQALGLTFLLGKRPAWVMATETATTLIRSRREQ